MELIIHQTGMRRIQDDRGRVSIELSCGMFLRISNPARNPNGTDS